MLVKWAKKRDTFCFFPISSMPLTTLSLDNREQEAGLWGAGGYHCLTGLSHRAPRPGHCCPSSSHWLAVQPSSRQTPPADPVLEHMCVVHGTPSLGSWGTVLWDEKPGSSPVSSPRPSQSTLSPLLLASPHAVETPSGGFHLTHEKHTSFPCQGCGCPLPYSSPLSPSRLFPCSGGHKEKSRSVA